MISEANVKTRFRTLAAANANVSNHRDLQRSAGDAYGFPDWLRGSDSVASAAPPRDSLAG